MSSESYEFDDDQPTRRWKMPLTWPMLLILAWILYELTTQSALGIITVCLKFGWNDFQTAFWSWRRDHSRNRAWAFFWFYLASGLWKTALAAFAPLFLLPILTGLIGGRIQLAGPGAAPLAQLICGLLTFFWGFAFSALSTVIASCIALRSRTRIWLNSAIYQDRIDDCWPPLNVMSGWPNGLGRSLSVAIFTISFTAAFSSVTYFLVIMERGAGQPLAQGGFDISSAAFVLTYIGCLFGLPFITMAAGKWLLTKIAARTPFECWPDAASQEQDLD
jgi:hypothetical protein